MPIKFFTSIILLSLLLFSPQGFAQETKPHPSLDQKKLFQLSEGEEVKHIEASGDGKHYLAIIKTPNESILRIDGEDRARSSGIGFAQGK